MGKELSPFRMDTSPLADLLITDGAERITKDFREQGLIPVGASYMTFSQIGGLWSPYTVFEMGGYDHAETRKLVDRMAAMSVAAACAAIQQLPEGLQSAARQLVGNKVGGKWSPHAVFELFGYDHAAMRELVNPIATMPVAAADATIQLLPKGLQSATRSMVTAVSTPSKNTKEVFINVVEDVISGTTTLYYYTCSNFAAALELQRWLGVTCSGHALHKVLSGDQLTACKNRITAPTIEDRGKAKLLGDAQALTKAYMDSPQYKALLARQDINRAKHVAKQAGKAKGISELGP
eukprot:scaffold86121_cov63-Phaeocystis_antarctica.AAC.4